MAPLGTRPPTMDERRAVTEGVAKKIIAKIAGDLDMLKAHGYGVTVFAFEFGEGGAMAYVSTCEREDMVKLVREWLAYQDAGLATEPRGERGRG